MLSDFSPAFFLPTRKMRGTRSRSKAGGEVAGGGAALAAPATTRATTTAEAATTAEATTPSAEGRRAPVAAAAAAALVELHDDETTPAPETTAGAEAGRAGAPSTSASLFSRFFFKKLARSQTQPIVSLFSVSLLPNNKKDFSSFPYIAHKRKY